MEQNNQRKLGEVLKEQGIITAKQLEEALKEQKVRGGFIGEILFSRGAVSEEKLARGLSQQLGFAFVDLSEMNIEPKAIDLVPEELCRKYTLVPVMVQNTITVAMSNPLNVQAVDEIQSVSGYRARPVFACPAAILKVIEKEYNRQDAGDSSKLSGDKVYEEARFSTGKASYLPSDQIAFLKQSANLAPVINRVNDIISKAVEMGASDIHLEPEQNSFNCRCRVDGILYSAAEIAFEEQASVISRIKIMANMDIAEKRLPQDGRLRMPVAGRDVDLRVSTFPTMHGENVVIRILDRFGGILKLEQLGFSKENLMLFSQLIHRPYGIILVTGPTGSGKTTTLYAALNDINSLEKNIITLEDPVEYEIPHIRQSQVNVKAGLTFAKGLRSIVRQDPDIIMIGEIRDKETADIAIHAALTGHLVFSTLHTNDAPSAVARLIDMGVEPFLVASSVIGILAQRLVRTLCDSCKEKYTPSAELLKEIGIRASYTPPSLRASRSEAKQSLIFYKEKGCHKCKQRGYKGRIGIYEFLIPNDRTKELIGRKASAPILRDEVVQAGMKTLRDAGFEKVAKGITSASELFRVTEEA
ncbi:MAG: GspE/PulE family protein [Candidatus Omnitrophota bacterium]